MNEKNESSFHLGDLTHRLWLEFEYVHHRFAKKVGMEVVDVGVDLTTSACLGVAVGGPHAGITTIVGGATTKAINVSVNNASRKATRDDEMRKAHQRIEAKPLPPLEAAESINIALMPNHFSLKYYSYIWPGYDRFRRTAVSCRQDYANGLLGFVVGSPDFNLKRLIYYKPPKSGRINHSIIDYLFLVQGIFDYGDREKEIFDNLDALWLMSRNWPMLDYLFFNYGFFKNFINYTALIDAQRSSGKNQSDEIVQNFLYTSRFYFLSKDFYLEHFFRIVMPTYEIILQKIRKNNVSDTPGNVLNYFLSRIHEKTENIDTTRQGRKGFLTGLKSIGDAVFHRTMAKKYTSEIKASEKYLVFFEFIEEFSKKLIHMDLDLQLNFLDALLCQFLNTNFQLHDRPKSYDVKNIIEEFRRCFEDDKKIDSNNALDQRFCPKQRIDLKLRNFFASYRYFPENASNAKEFEKLKHFIRKKLYSISHAANIDKEISNIGSFRIVQKFLDTLLNDGLVRFEKEFEQFDFKNSTYFQFLDAGVSDGVIRAIAIIVISIVKNRLDSGSHKTILSMLASSLGCTRITAGTTHYLYQLLIGESFITSFLGSGISTEIVKSAVLGPNILNLFTDLAMQTCRQYMYQQIDKKCLMMVDNLVVPFGTVLQVQDLTSPDYSPTSPLQGDWQSLSALALNDDQRREQLFAQLFIYSRLDENIQTTGLEVSKIHPDPAKHVCFQFVGEILFKKYLNQAHVFAKLYADSDYREQKHERYAQIFLAASDCSLKFIFLKKSMQIVFDYYDSSKGHHEENIEYLKYLNKSFQLHDDFQRSVNSLTNLINALTPIFDDAFSKPAKDMRKAFQEHQNILQRIISDLEYLKNSTRILYDRAEQLRNSIITQQQRPAAMADEQQHISAQQKEEAHARRLNLGFRLSKPFCILTESEKIILYRDFGRSLRHLFQNVKKPTEILSCEASLFEILEKIQNATQIDESKVKSFVKLYFDYSHAILETEMFIHYARIYQFLQERLRLEFLDISNHYIENLSDYIDLNAPAYTDASIRQSIENMQELLRQLQHERRFYFGVNLPT